MKRLYYQVLALDLSSFDSRTLCNNDVRELAVVSNWRKYNSRQQRRSINACCCSIVYHLFSQVSQKDSSMLNLFGIPEGNVIFQLFTWECEITGFFLSIQSILNYARQYKLKVCNDAKTIISALIFQGAASVAYKHIHDVCELKVHTRSLSLPCVYAYCR